MDLYLKIALPLPLRRLFTYKLETDLIENYIGRRALVPFNKRIITGFIIEQGTEIKENTDIKSIIEILDEEQIISDKMMNFYKWIADYYLSSLGEAIKAGLPQGISPESLIKIKIIENLSFETLELIKKKAPKRYELIQELKNHTEYVSVGYLQKKLNNENISSQLESLKNSGVIDFQSIISEQIKSSIKKAVLLKNELFENKEKLESIFKELDKKAFKQSLLLSHIYINQTQGNTPILANELIKNTDSNMQSLHFLEKKGYIEIYSIEIDRSKLKKEEKSLIFKDELSYILNSEQEECYNKIADSIDKAEFKPFLLFGITGSGKTLVYIKAIQKCLDLGKNALILVPEISLTPQLIDRFRNSFGDDIAVIHSSLSQGERYDSWRYILKGKKRVVIGVRSAVFAPLDNIGLIIVDEEHESSYKQDSPSPRYNARDCSILRAKKENAVIVLGSATPSVESYYNALNGRYELLEIKNRADNAEIPEISLIDLASERKNDNLIGSFSKRLIDQIIETTNKKEGVILLQNRRGFATSLECIDCGYVPYCVNCSVALTYHKFKNQLRCHYCGFTIPNHPVCPACGNPELKEIGFGTQRIEDELREILQSKGSTAKIFRLDYDTAGKKGAYRNILHNFATGEIDILVGTQMVAKGLDFPHVTLVGVINADLSLFIPDFRAGEKTFQILTQVSGRAGRSNEKKGKVLIQTRQAYNNIFKSILEQSYLNFYNEEIVDRQKANYPPFSRFVMIHFYSKNEQKVHNTAENFRKSFPGNLDFLEILGPTVPQIYKIKNDFRRVIILKSIKEKDINGLLIRQSILNAYEHYKNNFWDSSVSIVIDMDSHSTL
jgi:primosomal protein N' (replication factor Y)